MLLEAILIILGFYIFSGISIYVYCVIKTYEQIGVWSFEITDNFVGICKYPKWVLFWMEWIYNKLILIISKFKKGGE